jgi:hypothetical protein
MRNQNRTDCYELLAVFQPPQRQQKGSPPRLIHQEWGDPSKSGLESIAADNRHMDELRQRYAHRYGMRSVHF